MKMKFITIHNGEKNEEATADRMCAGVSKIGTVAETAVWSEKEYKDNKSNINSNQYFVFIGETLTGNNIKTSPDFEIKYQRFNMMYGWLGRQAVISLDKNFTWSTDYLKQFAEIRNEVFKEEIKYNNKSKSENFFSNINNKIKDIPLIGKVAVLVVGAPFFGIFGSILAVTSAAYIIKGKIDINKITEDSWQVVHAKFLKEGLNDFLGIKDE